MLTIAGVLACWKLQVFRHVGICMLESAGVSACWNMHVGICRCLGTVLIASLHTHLVLHTAINEYKIVFILPLSIKKYRVEFKI